MAMMRRTRWYPPPPPTPRILHLTRRPRRRTIKNVHLPGRSVSAKEMEARRNQRGKLETLFDQERAFAHTVPVVLFNNGDCERRERVEEDFQFTEKKKKNDNNNGDGGGEEEEKWRFQAEILRAECNFLRLEREVALRKLEMNRVQTKKTLRSAVETLILGKKKIFDGKNVDVVLEEEIEELEEKLDELQRKSGATEIEVRKCSNFDKKASVLQTRLEKLGFEEKCVQEIQEKTTNSIDTSTCRINQETSNRFTDDVEILGRKMEGLSKGMLERMEEEYRSMLTSSSSSATASANSSTSTSSRFEFPSGHQNHKQERMFREEKACSGRCKAIVRKIVEQVKAEMEQWSQMQEMLGRVREEMEELQASRDFWQDRALDSDDRVQSLQSAVQDWQQKTKSSETKVSELQKQVCDLHIELDRFKAERIGSSRVKALATAPLMDLSSQKEKEKRVLICSLKEKRLAASSNNKQMNKENCKDDVDARIKGRHACGRDRLSEPKQSPLRATENPSSPIFRQLNQRRLVLPLGLKENCPVYSNNKNDQMMNKDYYKDAGVDGIRKGRGRDSHGRITDPNRSPLQAMESSSSPKPIFRQLKNRGPMSPLSLKENCQAYSNNYSKQMKKDQYHKDDNGRRKGSVIGSDGNVCPQRSPLGATEISLPSMFRQHSNRGLVFPMN